MESFGHQGRLEDERMLKGAGRYVADWRLPAQACGHFLRSDHPHAQIVSIDASAALHMPGVIAVLTGEDVAAAGHKPMPAAAPMKGRNGAEQKATPRYSLARGRVLYQSYCDTCHGPSGMGDGPVSMANKRAGPFAGVFPLVTAIGRSDGYIYNLLRVGGVRMPSYKRIPKEDRWHLVNYVRYLQKGGRP